MAQFNIVENPDNNEGNQPECHRRTFLQRSTASLLALGTSATVISPPPSHAAAESDKVKPPLDSCLYTILRAREATEQETRLIKSGKFKDVQRANVKLAVRFIVQNYRLADNFIAASSYLEGNKRIKAGELGQDVVQSLYTILEYFDSSDVANLRVGEFDNMAGKETLVLKGLEAARNRIDEFVAFFPASEVNTVKAKIQEENELNAQEFDSNLGSIINPNPSSP